MIWKEVVHVSPNFTERKPGINRILEDFTELWDGNLGTIQAVKNQIDLDPAEAIKNPQEHIGQYLRHVN